MRGKSGKRINDSCIISRHVFFSFYNSSMKETVELRERASEVEKSFPLLDLMLYTQKKLCMTCLTYEGEDLPSSWPFLRLLVL